MIAMMEEAGGVTSTQQGGAVVLGVMVGAVVGLVLWTPAHENPVTPVEVSVPPLVPVAPDTVTLPVPITAGSTFGQLMAAHGVSSHAVREAASPLYDLAKIRPDRELYLVYQDGEASPVAVEYVIDGDRTLGVFREGSAWTASVEEVQYQVTTGTIDFQLETTLWDDSIAAGIRANDLPRLARIFEYELDFNTELRAGARFSLVAEILTAEGRPNKLGAIRAVRLANDGSEYVAVAHMKGADDVAYYYPDGRGMQRPFLRSPIEFSRVSSGFNRKRYHPILKTSRAHNGVDLAASTGTSVRAVADGKVVFSGTNGGHGKFVKIDHDGPWETSYSHLSRIDVSNGKRVRQGEIIGRVGATGLATGPHLHWQMWREGRFVDPMKVELPRAASLKNSERAAFAEACEQWLPQLPGWAASPRE